jgi:hypothetical protein
LSHMLNRYDGTAPACGVNIRSTESGFGSHQAKAIDLLDALEKEIAIASEQLASLDSALHFVLLPSPPEELRDGDSPRPPESPLCGRIKSATHWVAAISAKIADVKSRLTV